MNQSQSTFDNITHQLDVFGIQIPIEERDMTAVQFRHLLTTYLEAQVSDTCSMDEWLHVLATNSIEEYVDSLSSCKLAFLAAGISVTIISPTQIN